MTFSKDHPHYQLKEGGWKYIRTSTERIRHRFSVPCYKVEINCWFQQNNCASCSKVGIDKKWTKISLILQMHIILEEKPYFNISD